MNARILELIKNPELIENHDLGLLNSEIKKHPYIQNIRALQLYGVHRHRPEDYQNVLATTAAYTTDKKILYQFINKSSEISKEQNTKPQESVSAAPTVQTIPDENIFTQIPVATKPSPKAVYVNGELNRILFEGEEDFLERESPAIDLEMTKESGVITTKTSQKEAVPAQEYTSLVIEKNTIVETGLISDNQHIEDNIKTEELEEFPVSNEVISAETPSDRVKQTPAEVNFHGTEDFLPNVKLTSVSSKPTRYQVPTPPPNKHELEMQRLIAEVEAKMKGRPKAVSTEEESLPNTDVDFSDVQDFALVKPPEEISEPEISDKSGEEEVEIEASKITGENHAPIAAKLDSPTPSTWKPMNVAGHTPDSLIKPEENKTLEVPSDTQSLTPTSGLPQPTEEKPVFNISFFTQKVTSLETEKASEILEDLKNEPKTTGVKDESNVPVFINTWQNWLKIDRNSSENHEKKEISKEEEKNRVIETFIVKEPRISKLREETDFVVKERGDNISHLMTETLAKLYTEQKLYSKAIKAYQILTDKYPEKKPHFDEQIKVIKDLRQTNNR